MEISSNNEKRFTLEILIKVMVMDKKIAVIWNFQILMHFRSKVYKVML